MRPTPISSHFRPALGLGAGALPFLTTAAQAAEGAAIGGQAFGGQAFDGATIVAALCFFFAPFLIFATVYFRRKFRDADARATDLEARLEREQALLCTAPQAIVCWDTAIAIFGADWRLEFFNTAYVKLWDADETSLQRRPRTGEILEEFREPRKILEQANFPAFKAARNAMFASLLEPLEELDHLPDGKTLRVMITPHPLGGLLFTWEAVTASLALKRSFNTPIAVQKETLDNLCEAVAVIGGDGRL
jgi:PAS domain-containing protein